MEHISAPPLFIATLFTVTKMETNKFQSTDEWMKEMWDIHKMEYYSAIKEGSPAFCNKVDGL